MDPESVRFMAREILVLRRLDHPNVMKLEGMITSRVSGSLYLIFEYMEHDLAGLAGIPGIKFTESQVFSPSFCISVQRLHENLFVIYNCKICLGSILNSLDVSFLFINLLSEPDYWNNGPHRSRRCLIFV